MLEEKAKFLDAISRLSPVVVALVVLAGALWLQMQERRFEADRADKDRNLTVLMLRESIESAKEDRAAMQLRGDRFVANQKVFLEHQAALVEAVELQVVVLQKLKEEQMRSTEVMEQTLRRETQILIDAVIEANK